MAPTSPPAAPPRPDLACRRPLAELPVGGTGIVTRLDGDPTVRPRLLELGILPGTRVRIVREAPLRCPVEIEVGEARFSMRRELARAIEVEPVDE